MKARVIPQKSKNAPQPKKEASMHVSNVYFEPRFWAKHWKEILLLVIPVVLLYIIALKFEYVLDDQIVVTKNNYVKKGLNGVWDILSTETFMGYFGEQKNLIVGARYRPLSVVTFAIEHAFFGQNSAISHLINIILYGLTILLLFRIFSILIRDKEGSSWYTQLTFLACMLFAVHPIHSELVANVKGRDEIMVLLGVLGSMYATLKYLKTPNKLWLIFSFISFFLGLLSKENGLTFIAIIPLSLYFFSNARVRDYIITTLPLLGASLLYLIIRYKVVGYFLSSGTPDLSNVMNNPFLGMSFAQKYATILYTLGKYLILLVFPKDLTHDYYPYHIPVMNWLKPETWLSFLAYFGLIYIAYRGYKKKTIFSFSILFYLIALSIVSNILFPIGTFMNERFIFISSIGFCLGWAYLWTSYLPSLNPGNASILKKIGIGILALYLIGYSIKLHLRVPAWENPVTLNEAAIKVSYNSARSNNFTGTAYYNRYVAETDSTKKMEWFRKAKPYIEKAVTIIPDYADGLQMKLGLATEEFKNGGSLDTCLQRIYEVAINRPYITYTHQWLEYMNKVQPYHSFLVKFYIKTSQTLLERQDAPAAMKYLKYGLSLDPANSTIIGLIEKAKSMPQVTNRPYEIPAYMR